MSNPHLPPLTPEVLAIDPAKEMSIITQVRGCNDIQQLQAYLISSLVQLAVKEQVLRHIIKG